MKVFYIRLYFRNDKTGVMFDKVASQTGFSKEFALQKAYFEARLIESEHNVKLYKVDTVGVFTE